MTGMGRSALPECDCAKAIPGHCSRASDDQVRARINGYDAMITVDEVGP